ncbi:FUSC family protein [Tomitella fengzijianii]|uniref:FUSC family protein n=1 Tax=Tomitella fengzijianii TaxID=2597660 RepID=A0A516X6K9_9ACTN|nr:FUSC family protein [Tomitella fengzijianii]QDQ98696.1 FUSC family protein [Tomitella fengzijianii]
MRTPTPAPGLSAPDPTALRSHVHRARTAARHSRDRSTWRRAFTLNPASPSLVPALRVGVATALVLVVGGALGHTELAALAGLGAITAAFARGEPYRRRAGKTAVAGSTIIGSILLGSALTGTPMLLQIAVLSVAGGAGAWLLASLRIIGPGAVVIVFAGSAAAMTGDLPRAALATALGVAVGWLCAMAPVTRAPEHGTDEERRWIRSGLTRLASAEFLGAGARITVAALVAGLVALGVGLEHPLWASMGATAALQSITFASTVQRSIQRLVGNVTGAAVALAFIAAGLGFWPTAAAIVALQVLTELTIARNYAVATTAITPMALLMMGLSGGLTTSMALSRVADTAIGVIVGVVIAAMTIHPDDTQHLARA